MGYKGGHCCRLRRSSVQSWAKRRTPRMQRTLCSLELQGWRIREAGLVGGMVM